MLKDRQKIILEEIIREHIRTARPIASQELTAQIEVKASPATIRLEMLELDRQGYLKQPHTSAGRVPSDKGYRFFVDYLIDESIPSAGTQKTFEGIFGLDEIDEMMRGLAKSVAHFTHTFAFAGLIEEEEIAAKTGFSHIVDEPEFKDAASVKTFGRLVDMLDEDVHTILEDMHKGESVFIGGENPMEEAEDVSMLVSTWRHPRGSEGFLALVGPKRMDYQKNISLLRFIKAL